jgi:hypothetical protein
MLAVDLIQPSSPGFALDVDDLWRVPMGTPDQNDPRWEYKILWRYGAIVLVLVGLLAMGFGAADAVGTVISVTLLPIGFVCLLAGVALPRIEGKFTAGPSGMSADIIAVHQLDRPRYIVSGPALAIEQPEAIPSGEPEAAGLTPSRAGLTRLGDVWEALDAAGLRPMAVGMGHAYFRLADGRQLSIPNKTFLDHGVASDDLLAVLATLGVRPTASGRFPTPSHYPVKDPVVPAYLPPPYLPPVGKE